MPAKEVVASILVEAGISGCWCILLVDARKLEIEDPLSRSS